MFKIIRTGILLGLVCFISAVALSQVYQHTKDKIAAQSRSDNFLKDIFKTGEKFVEERAEDQSYFLAYAPGGGLLGAAIPVNVTGYGGEIKLLVGVDLDGRVVNFQVLEQNETPGLGAKITTPGFIEQFKGKDREKLILTIDDSQRGKIDAITSATISSRAVVDGIKKGIDFFESNLKLSYRDSRIGIIPDNQFNPKQKE